ncbi:MAG: Gamma-glutamyl phosphate reductase [Verrucomicrobiota bacterium]
MRSHELKGGDHAEEGMEGGRGPAEGRGESGSAERPPVAVGEAVRALGRRARVAGRLLARCSAAQRDAGLLAMADALIGASPAILRANALDVEAARARGLSAAMLDRLTLTEGRVAAMAEGIRRVASLPDPVGEVLREWTAESGVQIRKVRVPIGVIGIIYESRPNVTSDAAVLCTKTGNATILRGGSESLHSNVAIAAALSAGCAAAGLPEDSILLIPFTDREAVRALCEMDEFLDLLIPRGGKGLIETVVAHARMPVIKHYDGVCAFYVDAKGDMAMAEALVLNAKCQRPGVCNAIETVLVHQDRVREFQRVVGRALVERGVEVRCDAAALSASEAVALPDSVARGRFVPATEADFRTEFLDLILAVKTVDGLEAAIAHIEAHGSHHSDGIITEDPVAAERFLQEVDSATVYWNASTRFTDGGEFGFGAEIGISTDKLHARGPMGLEELTTYKYQIRGHGEVRR